MAAFPKRQGPFLNTQERKYVLVFLGQRKAHQYAVVNNTPALDYFFIYADLKPAFRLSRTSINHLINLLPRKKDHGWSHEIEILVTIYWLACGASYRVTASIFSMPTSTVCTTVHNVVEEMMTILHQIIHFPKEEELENIGAGFAGLGGHEVFRLAAGAIDGCHIRILPPAEPQKKSYINRKLFPSIVLQGICDGKGNFLDVYIGNSGSVHDAMVLRRSPMFKQALYPPAGFFLLGDGGYPCLQHPVFLWLRSFYFCFYSGRVEQRYNRHHAKARTIIERTFGMLKTRWRSIFLRALEIRPLFAPKVVAACCILHICVAADDILAENDVEEGSEDDGGEEVIHTNAEELSGSHFRARLAAQLSAPAAQPAFLNEHDYI
uniref:DDE Tnp4 domain-containing protein n=1 Tax=Poecilia latipinna TaxID=48699 RepID=A0A3B3UQ93_9TELE